MEGEEEIDESVVCLDWYDSDLSMRIDKEEHMGGEPFNRCEKFYTRSQL